VYKLKNYIKDYPDFPKPGIIFKDILPILKEPEAFRDLINDMSKWELFKDCDSLLAIDARGFIFGSAIAIKLSKPLVLARKKGKLPGKLIEDSYSLEYGNNILCIQEDSLNKLNNFIIIDDLLATGGTVSCIEKLLTKANKKIIGLSVVVELEDLKGKCNFEFPVDSQIKF
tara:strand:- start:116 stop:628 length:513 start_codon:yes stop_codon:yes gene_type:complete